jgi:hypothetical protein
LVDDLNLRDGLGLSPEAIETLRKARDTLLTRRLTRGRGDRG